MAITPNTDFVSGAILTAQQQNNFPRGIMQRVVSTSTYTGTPTETVTLTLPAFTAVANRMYKVTYFEPYIENLNANMTMTVRIRMTNLAGTIIARGEAGLTTVNNETQLQAVYVGTLPAGSTVMVGTAQNGAAANAYFYGATEYLRMLWVEDLGPA
jgi:uncharacterized membrane protein AbrB (regulator of aidB expression)